MFRVASILAILVLLVCCNSKRVRYDGFNIYRTVPQHQHHLEQLAKIQVNSVIFFDPIVMKKNVDILVAPEQQQKFRRLLATNGIPYRLIEEDIQRSIDDEAVQLNRKSGVYDWTGYHTLNETYNWLDSLARQYPGKVQVIVGGKTNEGREIRGVKISFKPGNRGIFLEGGIHANEWISPITVTYILNQILSNEDFAVRSLVEKFDWYIFPHFNPDGYVYTHTTDRLWRKTRAKGQKCDGVDPNRNWDFHWDETKDDECSRSYPGTSKFSETETRTLSEFLSTLKDAIRTYVAFHSFKQVLVYPYGVASEIPRNRGDLQRIGEAMIKTLSKRYGTQYEVGTIYDLIYLAAGSGPDWVYSNLNVPLVFTYELRPRNSTIGCVLPSAQIIPTGEETFDSILTMLSEAEKLGYYD